MIGAALAVVRALLPSTTGLVLWGVVIAGAGGAATWWSVHEYNKGYAAAIAAVAAQDKEAVDAVGKVTSSIDDCARSGRVWRPATGQCEGR